MKVLKIYSNHKSDFLYIIASIVSPIVGMISSVVSARFVLPAELGTINKVLIILSYTSFCQLGVYNGLNRNIAYYKAKNQPAIVQTMVDTSYYMTRKISFLLLLVSIGLIVYNFVFVNNPISIWASVLLCVLAFLQNFNTHFEVTYRSGQEFKKLGIIKLKDSAIAIACLIFPYLCGVIGYMLSYGLKVFISFILRKRHSPYAYEHKESRTSYWELLKVGFPIMIAGYLWSIFMVADVTFLSMFYSNVEVGLYNIATLSTTAIMVIPNALNTLLYPKASAIFAKTDKPSSLRPFCIKSICAFALVLTPIVLLGYFLLPYFVEIFMPNYIGGVKVGQIAILSGLTFIYAGPSVVFGTLKKNIPSLLMISSILLLYWLLLLLLHYNSRLTMEKIAYLKLTFLSLYSISTIGVAFYLMRK